PGAPVCRGAAPLPALAAARLRPGAAPRRGALPLPAGDVRAGHPGHRRPPVRGVLLAAAGGAGRRAVRPARRVGTGPRGCRVTELFEPAGPFDRRLALSAAGVLAEANAAGVLTAADVHVARRLGD